MASWDSMGIVYTVHLNVDEVYIPVHYRIVYDTPNDLSLMILIDSKDAEKLGIVQSCDWGFVILKDWYRSSSSFDVREMKDQDVIDIFSVNIDKFLKRLSKQKLTKRQFCNLLNRNGIDFVK